MERGCKIWFFNTSGSGRQSLTDNLNLLHTLVYTFSTTGVGIKPAWHLQIAFQDGSTDTELWAHDERVARSGFSTHLWLWQHIPAMAVWIPGHTLVYTSDSIRIGIRPLGIVCILHFLSVDRTLGSRSIRRLGSQGSAFFRICSLCRR